MGQGRGMDWIIWALNVENKNHLRGALRKIKSVDRNSFLEVKPVQIVNLDGENGISFYYHLFFSPTNLKQTIFHQKRPYLTQIHPIFTQIQSKQKEMREKWS